MAPFDVITDLGKWLGYLVYLLIGMGFGAVLEMSGFGDSRKLAAQFYFKDMTVLKVMFTAIVVAMVLIFAFSGLGLLDFSRVFVNPTYLLPGIIGGLIMGVGFIVGGFCPGTSIVALSTLKVDGFFFAGGVAFGAFMFGESLSLFRGFHNSSFMGRFILPELFGVSTGVVVFFVVLMALTMFYWAEISEKFFGRRMSMREIRKQPSNKRKIMASASLVFISLFVLFSGQPTPEEKWNRIKEKETQRLESREVYIHPGELLEAMNDPMLYATILDVRAESEFNLFHLENARNTTMDDIYDLMFIRELNEAPANTVMVVYSNNERDATEAYKLIKAQGVLNLYILDGGVNHWLKHFPLPPDVAAPRPSGDGDSLHYRFTRSVGDRIATSANPEQQGLEQLKARGVQFKHKIKIQKKKVISGSCG